LAKINDPVTNCGYGLISHAYAHNNTDFVSNYAANDAYGTLTDKLALVCRACKPGYRPSYLDP
jgi:hypothetical protein